MGLAKYISKTCLTCKHTEENLCGTSRIAQVSEVNALLHSGLNTNTK